MLSEPSAGRCYAQRSIYFVTTLSHLMDEIALMTVAIFAVMVRIFLSITGNKNCPEVKPPLPVAPPPSAMAMATRSTSSRSAFKSHSHTKLLASELLTLTTYPSIPASFTRRLSRASVSRAEILGVVVSRDSAPKFLRFLLDDGTGCVPCVLWLAPPLRKASSDADPAAEILQRRAPAVRIGEQLRVRGRVSLYRGEIQVTVRDVVVERDPNMETLHRLDCVRIARRHVAGF